MTRKSQAKVVRLMTVLLAATVVPASAEIPDGVSPGAVDRIAEIEGRCPTFIWGTSANAIDYQLVAYRLPEGLDRSDLSAVDLSDADQVLYAKVPGTASAWTPELAECLAPGGNYVWFVRAVFREDQGEVVEASEWSYGRFFSISPMPSAREVEDALRVLRRYTGHSRSGAAAMGQQVIDTELTDAQRSGFSQRRAGSSVGEKSVTSAKTAIKGSVSDITGETYGVVGVSASTDGAGLGAANTGGGPDLVLDGVADGATDTLLRESGIYRNSGSIESFTIANSTYGLGGISLQVQGPVVVEGQLSADSAAITNGVTVGTTLGVQGALSANSANITTTLGVGALSVSGDLLAILNTWGTCYWTGWFSEEQGPRYCAMDRYVVGMECDGKYCDNVRLYCCEL
jgi:hypothetical protein